MDKHFNLASMDLFSPDYKIGILAITFYVSPTLSGELGSYNNNLV